MLPPFLATLLSFAQTAIFLYITFAVLFFVFSDSVLYQPPRPTLFQDTENTIKLPLPDGKRISALYLKNPNAKFTILFSHGNAEDLGYLLPYLQLYRINGYSVFAYDYEGYGTSDGRTNEKNTYRDIEAAYAYLTNHLKVPPETIIIFGRSLGAGPSTYLAQKVKAKALILESAFISAYRVKTIIPLFPFDKYPILSMIAKVNIPVLIIHGQADSIIPIWHGRKIFDAIKGYKQAYWVENANHNDLVQVADNAYWQNLAHFLQSVDNLRSNE